MEPSPPEKIRLEKNIAFRLGTFVCRLVGRLTTETPWERFDNAFRKIITVPKEVFLKEEEKRKRAREKKRAATGNKSKASGQS